jgi:hypothetical protein
MSPRGQVVELRLDRLLGRNVLALSNRRVGRIEEFRAEIRGSNLVITAFVIGPAGLVERLGLGVGLLVGRRKSGHVARWDQIDTTDPEKPRLTCSLDELERLE